MIKAPKRHVQLPGGDPVPARPGSRSFHRAALLLLAVLAGGACGGNLTAGGFSEVEAYVAGDDAPGAEGTATSTAPGAAPVTGGILPGDIPSATIIEGTVTATLRLEVMDDRRVWTEITRGPTTVTVPLVGEGPGALLATASLPPGRYIRSRITFEEVEADVVRGLQVDGLDLRGRVRVEFEAAAGRAIQEALFLDLREGDRAQLAVALNSQLWLRLVNAVLRRVPEAGFRQAVRVRVL